MEIQVTFVIFFSLISLNDTWEEQLSARYILQVIAIVARESFVTTADETSMVI